eukprot:10356333-Alexandrium_andersonii.AAC.1
MHVLCTRRAEYVSFAKEAQAIMLRVPEASAGIGVAKAKVPGSQMRGGGIDRPRYPVEGE